MWIWSFLVEGILANYQLIQSLKIQRNKTGNLRLNRTASGKIESTKDQKDPAEVQPMEKMEN